MSKIAKRKCTISAKELLIRIIKDVSAFQSMGWINYFRIGSMKQFLKEFSEWLRHKVRVIIVKMWKKPRTIYRNLQRLNQAFKCGFTDEDIYKVANTRLGWYRRSAMNVVNFLLSPKVLTLPNKKEGRPGLVDPLAYYLSGLQ